MIAIAGRLTDLSALTTAQYPEITVGDRNETRRRTTFDHLLMQSRLANGGTLAIEVAGGRPPATPFRMDVIGETGTLRLDGGAPHGFQSSRLTLSVNGETTQHWLDGLLPLGLVVSPVESLEEALQSGHTQSRNMTVDVPTQDGIIRLVGNPIKNEGVADSFAAPPLLGEHANLVRTGIVS